MTAYSSEPDFTSEPKRRFYPTQDPVSASRTSRIPSVPDVPQQAEVRPLFSSSAASVRKKNDDATYFTHRHPLLLQRLYQAADTLLATYHAGDFIYDAYPDFLSLGWMRDRLLRENASLTESFLQAGCPLEWLNLLTDTVLSEQLCRRRCSQRNPRGEASTTSVQSLSRS